jgi:3'(2'), 5'-bisphosphate nucleotidase
MQNILDAVIAIAKQAGEAINTFYHATKAIDIEIKSDQSPLTQADLAANQIIVEGLQKLTPKWPVLSEESVEVPFNERAGWEYYWLVDPLDGTKEFLEHNDEFTVNIALIKNNYPVLGVVYVPAVATCYYAAEMQGAYKQIKEEPSQKIQTQKYQPSQINIAVSRHHGSHSLQNFLKQFTNINLITCGSALKFCLVAEGKADVYPRLSPTSEWDTAAAQCVLEQAGGAVIVNSGARLCYNKKVSLLNPNFLAVGDLNHHWQKYFEKGI